ncbi:MAG: Gfo/Idh/MocA family oxidoreductase [Myxococcales bacterium]|nr:Gfo/Idh/MocA family oxidoreductase [Myxococcales bacterium]
MTRISVGIFGLGRMGRLHARVLSELPSQFSLVGFHDPDESVATPEWLRVGTAEALLEACDLALVASPPDEHASLVTVALARGRRVFVEKPLAPTPAVARRLAHLAAPGQLFVGHSERFNPVVRALRSLIAEDEVLGIEIERSVAVTSHSQGDVVLNLGVHDLDLVAHLTGRRPVVLGAEGDANATRVHLSAGAAFGRLRLARAGRHRMLTVTTRDARYEGDLLAFRLRKASVGGGAVDVPVPTDEPLVAQARALYEACQGAPAAPLATAEDGLRAVELAETAMGLRSLRGRTNPAAAASA